MEGGLKAAVDFPSLSLLCQGRNYGIILIPEGLVEHAHDLATLVAGAQWPATATAAKSCAAVSAALNENKPGTSALI